MNDPGRDSESQRQILEMFRSRLEAGESVDVEEFVRLHPELETEFRMIFDWLELRPVVEEDLSAEPGADAVPPVLDDFKIIRKIGSGSMATVYVAEQLSLKRKVALKVLSSHLSFSKQAITKFRREAEAGGRQVHPGIVTVYAVGEHDEMHYIAQELIGEGVTLADRIDTLRRQGGIPIGFFREAAELFARTADALQFAHNAGVVHRDVKPSNILLTKDGLPKVCDFGLATIEDALAPSRSSELAGSPAYMSPEQLSRREKEVDDRTDIFSLGVTFFETLTLERPFGAPSARQIMQKVLFHDPGDARKANPRVPRDLSVICQKTLEKDPGRRYQTMAEFSADLHRFLAGEPITARPVALLRRTWSWMRRHRLATLAGFALVIALLTIVYLSYVVSRQQRLKGQFSPRQFKAVKEVRRWPDMALWDAAWTWTLTADPGDPGGFLLAGIFYTERDMPVDAEKMLDQCIEACRERGDDVLKREARFLLGAIKLSLADAEDESHDEQRALANEARDLMKRAGEFEPSSEDTVFWRDFDPATGTPADARDFLRKLELNSKHYLIQLDLGVGNFTRLYKGGSRQEFIDTIGQLRMVLEGGRDNIAALTFLGRVYFFYARSFGYFNKLDRARTLLETASQLTVDRPYHLIETSLGQIRMLHGNLDGALAHFSRAIEIEAAKNLPWKWLKSGIHNAYCGKGNVFAMMGRHEDAEREYDKALDISPGDIHVWANMARLRLHQGRAEEALGFARSATTFRNELPNKTEVLLQTQFAPAFLLCARAHLALGQYRSSESCLWRLFTETIEDPRSWSLGCFVVATFPDEVFDDPAERDTLRMISDKLAAKSGLAAPDSALSLSARGAARFLAQDYKAAKGFFESAADLRESWPASVRRCLWHYDAIDAYLLSMVYAGIARNAGRDPVVDRLALEHFERAEKKFLASKLPFDESDIVTGIREKARRILGKSD